MPEGGIAGEAQHTTHRARDVVMVDMLRTPVLADGADATLRLDQVNKRLLRQSVLAEETFGSFEL